MKRIVMYILMLAIVSSCVEANVPKSENVEGVDGRDILVEKIILDKTDLNMIEKETIRITAEVLPKDASDKYVSWYSSDETIVSVDAYGIVTALKEGNAIVTASAGDKSAKCAVNVQKYIPLQSINLNKTTLKLNKGDSEVLTVTYLPKNASYQTPATWRSSDEAVIKVDKAGKVVAVGGGKAMVEVNAGTCKSTCSIEVVVPTQSIRFEKSSLDLFEGGQTTLTIVFTPEDATDKNVTWSSSNPSVFTVDGYGVVKAKKSGVATIKAVSGSKTAECMVNVQPLPEGAIDLGLSVLWATCNLGSSTPEDIGKYYAWDRPDACTQYAYFQWTNERDRIFHYNPNGGTVPLEYDNAHINLGDRWRMPTMIECEELLSKCSWAETTLNGISGCMVTGENGNAIFLPVTGRLDVEEWPRDTDRTRGLYWSSSVGGYYHVGRSETIGAQLLLVQREYRGSFVVEGSELRGVYYYDASAPWIGLCIRPVYGY